MKFWKFLILILGITIVIVSYVVFSTSSSTSVTPWPQPTVQELNEVLSGSQAVVEAQHTYYVHVSKNTKFADNIRELGSHEDKGGTLMVMDVWNASDGGSNVTPINGYLFTCIPFVINSNSKSGFVVAAYPIDNRATKWDWPVFISIVPDSKGGMIGMASADTWQIVGSSTAIEINALLKREKLSFSDIDNFSPLKNANSILVKNFRIDSR